MGKKEFRIRLSNPCHQEWDNMPQVKGGLFCKDCTKVVHDFTVMSDEEIIRILTDRSRGEVCGKFNQSQLEKNYVVENPARRRSYTAIKLLLLGVLSLRLPLSAQEQTGPQKTQTTQKKKVAARSAQIPKSIKGKVSNKKTKAGIDVKISLYYGTNTLSTIYLFSETFSNSDGSYEMELPDEGLETYFKLVFSGNDYQDRSVVVDKNHVPHFLPVYMAPLGYTFIVRPPQEVTGGVPERVSREDMEILTDRVSTTGEIPKQPDAVGSTPAPLWKRIKLKIIGMFRSF